MARPLPAPLAGPLATVLLLAVGAANPVHAQQAGGDTLLVERVQNEQLLALPSRGLSMAQVEARYGVPTDKPLPRGGQKAQWPLIHRWTYPGFTVYFERNRVVDAVANKAVASEVGPKPVYPQPMSSQPVNPAPDR